MDSSSIASSYHENEACSKNLDQRLEEYVERYHFENFSEFDETQDVDQEFEFYCQEVINQWSKSFKMLEKAWKELGFKNPKNERIQFVVSAIIETMNDAADKEMKSVQSLKRYISTRMLDINSLLAELTLPPFNVEPLPLIPMAKKIIDKHRELQALQKERMDKWQELEINNKTLRITLGLSPKLFNFNTRIPSEMDIEKLQTDVLDLNKIKAKRIRTFKHIQRSISELLVNLEKNINDHPLLKEICGDEECVSLSESFLAEIEELYRNFEKESENNRKTIETLKERLIKLWERLETPKAEQDSALEGIIGWKPSAIKALQEVVDFYEELKKENMGKFILKIREEILEYWTKCYSNQETKESFDVYFNDDLFTEQLLLAHEQELDKLKSYYRENIEIFRKLEQWEINWERFKDLESRANDPSRFNNRGGTLLKEEKIKKQTHKNLSRLEKELKTLAKQWSLEHNGAKFKVCGIALNDYLDDELERFHASKENEKRDRQKAKQLDIEAAKKGKKITEKNTPSVLMQRTPTRKLPGLAFGSSEKTRKMLTAKPLSPLNHDSRMLRATRSRMNNNLTNKSKTIKAANGQENTLILSNNVTSPQTIGLLLEEDQFRAVLKERKQDTFESTSISQKKLRGLADENSPLNVTFRKTEKSKTKNEFGWLDRRKSKSLISLGKDELKVSLLNPSLTPSYRFNSTPSFKSFKKQQSSIFMSRRPFRP